MFESGVNEIVEGHWRQSVGEVFCDIFQGEDMLVGLQQRLAQQICFGLFRFWCEALLNNRYEVKHPFQGFCRSFSIEIINRVLSSSVATKRFPFVRSASGPFVVSLRGAIAKVLCRGRRKELFVESTQFSCCNILQPVRPL